MNGMNFFLVNTRRSRQESQLEYFSMGRKESDRHCNLSQTISQVNSGLSFFFSSKLIQNFWDVIERQLL